MQLKVPVQSISLQLRFNIDAKVLPSRAKDGQSELNSPFAAYAVKLIIGIVEDKYLMCFIPVVRSNLITTFRSKHLKVRES